MKRLAWLALTLTLAVGVAAAQAAEESVSYKSGEETVSALVVTPAGNGPFPAVLVVQEWWGVNGWVKDQARALSKEGYVALAVDLYRGKVTDRQEEAHRLMMGTPPDRALRDQKAAFAYLGTRPDVKKDRIGSIGWCMGGRYSMAWPPRRRHCRCGRLLRVFLIHGHAVLVLDEPEAQGAGLALAPAREHVRVHGGADDGFLLGGGGQRVPLLQEGLDRLVHDAPRPQGEGRESFFRRWSSESSGER